MHRNPNPERVKVWYRRKRYVIIRDGHGLIGIEYDNAVRGQRRLFLDGELAKGIAAAYPELCHVQQVN